MCTQRHSLLLVDMASQSPSTNPIHEELTGNDLRDLLNTLNPVAPKCYDLGLQLGVEDTKMHIIEHDNRKCEDQLREILRERLKQESPLTWHDIVTALRAERVGEQYLANAIDHKYIHCQHPPASVPPQVSTESSVSLATSLLTSAQSSLPTQSISQCPTSPLANRESSLSVNTQSHLTPSQPSLHDQHTSPSTAPNTHHLIPTDTHHLIPTVTHHLIPTVTHHPEPPGQISTTLQGNTASSNVSAMQVQLQPSSPSQSQCLQPSASASSYSTASTDTESDTSTSNELLRDSSYCVIDRHTGALTDTISGDLTSFSNAFIELGFFTRPAADNILTKHGIGDRDKASQLLGLVTKNYNSSRDKKKWFDKFVSVFLSEAAYADLATSLLTSAQSSLPTQSISQYPTSPLANRESSLSVSRLTPSQPSLHDQHTSPSTQVIAPNTHHLIPTDTHHLIPTDTHHPRPPGHTSTALQAGPVLPPHFQPSLHSQSTGMQCPHPSGTTLQLYHSISPLHYPPPQPHTHHPHYQAFPPWYQPYYHPPHLPQHMSPSTVSQSVSSSDQFSCSSSSAVVASGQSLSHTAVGSVPTSGNSSPQTAHTTPQVQPPSMQPHAHDMTSHVGWGTPYGHPSYMYPPHPIPPYQVAHTPQPYPNTPYMLAPTNRPPLQEEVVGGPWNSQLHMSHSEPQSQRQSGSSSVDSRPPPAKRVHLQPLMQHYRSNTEPQSTYNQSHSSSSSLGSPSARNAGAKSPMDQYVDYVKDVYRQSAIEKDPSVLKWPPTPSEVFISLACIDRTTLVTTEDVDEYTRAMVEDGNVDVILKKKKNIDFGDIAQGLKATDSSQSLILVEGAPGVGKSTFAWEFCRRWERGGIAQQYQLVLLLRLRDDRMCRAKSLGNLIYHPEEDISRDVVRDLVSCRGVKTLIILEGFDELPDSQRRESSVFLQLILGKLLLHATILVTSRPWATNALMRKIEHRIFQHIEVLGFTEENVGKYVTSVFIDEKTGNAIEQSVGSPDEVSEEAKNNIDDVMTYLATYPQIKACMYIPLNAAIVVSIHKESKKRKCILPKTLTELYYALTQVLLLRYLYGHPEYSQREWNVHSFEKDLPAEVYTQLLSISKLAYDGICIKRGKRVQLIFPDLPAGFETLGFMQSVAQVYVQHGQKTSHNFLHLTVQEFLAARYISTMSPAEQLKHFQRHKEGRLRVVLRFLAGITELKNVTHEQLRGLLGEPDVKQSDEQQTLHCKPMRPDVCVEAHHTNWLFEAQNTDLLQSLLHNHTTSFTFTKAMLPLDYYSVGYCIAHSHSNWSLTFEGSPEENKVRMLVSGAETGDIQQSCVALKTSRSMTTGTLHLLFTCFSGCVEELYLRISRAMSMSLSDLSALRILELSMGMVADVSDFSSNCLESLTIIATSKVIFCSTSCEAIGKYLSSTCSLKTCHLRAVDGKTLFLNPNELEIITKGMGDNIALPLESLEIDCKCTFTTTATRSLAQFITRSTTLQYLRLCSVTFNVREFIELLVAVNHSSSLQENKLEKFDILCSDVSTEEDRANLTPLFNSHPDLVHIQSSLSDTTSLEQSNSACIVSAVIFALNHNYCKSLRLHTNGINNAGAVALAQALHHNSTLERLYLSNSSISDAGAVALAQALHHNSTLQELFLSDDAIGEKGTHQLVQALTVNTSISSLKLPKKCKEYATQCREYDTVMERIGFD